MVCGLNTPSSTGGNQHCRIPEYGVNPFEHDDIRWTYAHSPHDIRGSSAEIHAAPPKS
jgi:hypothetical protein